MTDTACRWIGCPDPVEPGTSWCIPHHVRHWEQVDPDLRERFAARMVEGITTNASGCWLYAGKRNPVTGYAAPRHTGRRTSGHRWMTWYLKEDLKPGYQLHHVCGGVDEQETRHCIRPAHLVQVLPGDHRMLTQQRAEMIAAAEPGARFYQTSVGETGRTVAFARTHDLPRHEVAHLDVELSTETELVAQWQLVIPTALQTF